MTIETRSSQNTSRPTSGADAHHPRSKPGGAGNPGQDAPSGFLAILASLDTSEPAVATTAVATDPALQAYAADTSALAEVDRDRSGALDPAAALDDAIGKLLQDVPPDVPETNLPVPTDAAVTGLPVATELPLQASALLAQSLQWTATPASSLEPGKSVQASGSASGLGPAATESPLHASALLAQSLQWTAAPASSLEPGKSVQASGSASGLGPGVRSQFSGETPQRAQVLGDWNGQSAKESIARTGRLQRDAVARQASVDAGLAEPADIAVQPDSRVSAFLAAKSTDQPSTPMATALAMANTLVPLRRDESTRERSVFRSTVPDGGAMAQTYAPTAAGAQTPGAVEPPAPTDMYVAEKVAYWISNDVQNAEMKLDGIGTEPVEVSIRMQGNEAHIAFRTDEVLARSALESASQHLKDLLQSEGLVLSGVSVGTSGAGDSGDQERRSRQGLRQSVVVSEQPAAGDATAGANRATRGALDLFV